MAFLDNSGDIILDAVLTDLGRKRMAEGDFRITQFALGDDEIDYSLYNANHPSGSAYYDLEILQTPVFEAFTQANANINYGLLTLGGTADVLYLPSLKINQKTANTGAKQLYQNVLYLATNNETKVALEAVTALQADKVAMDNLNSSYVLFETGLNNKNNDPAGTVEQRTNYITNLGLTDSTMTLTLDARFLTAVNQISAGSTFDLPTGTATSFVRNIVFDPNPTPASAGTSGVVGRRIYNIRTIPNLVFDQDDGSETNTTEIVGPRGNVTAMYFTVSPELKRTKDSAAPAKYSLHGKVAQNLFADGNTYDYIDTIAYLNGNSSGANTQLVIRVIRRAS
jgi:hypothetical protein